MDASTRKSLKFFVVDDDELILELQKSLLEAAGHTVLCETNSVEAFDRIQTDRPDCIVTDIMMPGIDGFELIKRLRESDGAKDAKIIVVSAKAYEFDRTQALKFGADGFILKPLRQESYASRIAEIIEDKIEMTFWGVRGTLPVPGKQAYKYGGNTSCVSLAFPKGQHFIFDAGTGIKVLSDHMIKSGRRRLDSKIFISHPHWDHINALPFFAPLYMQGNEFEVCGASHGGITMRQLISSQMDDIYFPITIREFASRVYFRDLAEEVTEVDGIEVRTMLLSHPGHCLGYRVEYKDRSICYVTDNELFLPDSEFYNAHYVKRLIEFLRGTDVLITDTTYTDEEYKTKVGWGHSCVSQVVDVAHRAEVETLYLFHHDPDQNDDAIDEKFEMASSMLAELGSSTACVAPAEEQLVKL